MEAMTQKAPPHPISLAGQLFMLAPAVEAEQEEARRRAETRASWESGKKRRKEHAVDEDDVLAYAADKSEFSRPDLMRDLGLTKSRAYRLTTDLLDKGMLAYTCTDGRNGIQKFKVA